jgi:hypothetical protein
MSPAVHAIVEYSHMDVPPTRHTRVNVVAVAPQPEDAGALGAGEPRPSRIGRRRHDGAG